MDGFTEVTDAELLQQLDGGGDAPTPQSALPSGLKPVEDPALLRQLDTPDTVGEAVSNAGTRAGLRITGAVDTGLAEAYKQRAEDVDRSFGEIVSDSYGIPEGQGFMGPDGRINAQPGITPLLEGTYRYGMSRLNSLLGEDKESLNKKGVEYFELARRAREKSANTLSSESKQRYEQAIQGGQSWYEVGWNDPAALAAMVGETVIESAPSMAAAIGATAITRNPTVGAAVMGATSYGQERYGSVLNFMAENGVDLSNPEQTKKALFDKDLMAKAQQYGLTRGVIIGILDAISGLVAGKALSSGILKNFAGQMGLQAGLGGTGEGLAQGVTKGWDKIDWNDVAIEALAEFATAPIEVVGVGQQYLRSKNKPTSEINVEEVLNDVAAGTPGARETLVGYGIPDDEIDGMVQRRTGAGTEAAPAAGPTVGVTSEKGPDQAQAEAISATQPAAPANETPRERVLRMARERDQRAAAQSTAPAPAAPPATPPVTPTSNQQAGAPTAVAGEPSAAVGAEPTAPPAPAPAPAPAAPNDEITANVPEAPAETAGPQLADIPYDTLTYDPQQKKAIASSGANRVIDYADRKIVVVNINGVQVPFYLSTGSGGKKNVAAGKWYPFFGIGKDGWINKTTEAEINNYYGIPELRNAAQELDRTIGDVRNDTNIPKTKATGAHVDFINTGLSPASNQEADTISRVAANIRDVATRLRGGAAPAATPTAAAEPEVTVPEKQDTLNIQRAELVDPDNERVVVQYPKGTNMKLYPKPDAARIERFPSGKYGTFDFDATKISRDQIRAAARAGKLNELLGLGPFNKQQVAESAAAGATPVAVTERTPEGTEVKAAAGTTETAPVQQQALEETKAAPENTVQVEDPRTVIEERLEPAPVRRTVTQGYEGPNPDLVQNRIAYLEQLAADESKSEAARREARTRAVDFKNYAELRDKLFEDNNTPEATRAQVRALAPDDVITGQTRKGETVTGRVEGWGSSGAIGIVDADGFNHDILPHTVTDAEMVGGAQATAPKAAPAPKAKRKVGDILTKQPGEGYRIGVFSFDFNERGGNRYIRVRDRSGNNSLQSKDGGAPDTDVTDIWNAVDPNTVEPRQGNKVGINSLDNNVPRELAPIFRDYLQNKVDENETLSRIREVEIGGAQAAAPKAAPKAEAAKEVSKAREEKKESAPSNTASVAFMMTKAMRAELVKRGYTVEQIKNMKPAEAQEILKSEPKNAATQEAPAPKAEEAKATSKAREEKAEAAPPKPRVLEDQSIESKKAKQEQAEQNEIIADQIKPFLKGRGKEKTLKDAEEKTGKNWTPAERAARRKLNEDSEKLVKEYAPTPEINRAERDFMDEDATKRKNARAAIRARAEAMLKAADEADIKLPEKVYGNTDKSMDLGAGAMNLVVARDFLDALKSPYKPVEEHYIDFLSRDMRLRRGLLDEVVSERRTEIDDKMRVRQGGNIEQISANRVGDTSAEADAEISADTKDVADAKIVGKDDVETKVSRSAKMAPKLDDGTQKGELTIKTEDGKTKKIEADVAKPASAGRVLSKEEKERVMREMGLLKREDASGNSIARRPLRDNEVIYSTPLTVALDRIGKLPGNKINKYIVDKILNRLRAKVGDVEVLVVEQDTLDDMFNAKRPGAVNGYYDPKNGYIVVSGNFMAANNGKFDAQLLAHEGVHAYLQEAIESDANLKKDIQDILDHVKSIAPSSMKNAYGLRDVQEFIAEAMSNPNFQNFLMRTAIPESLRSKYDAPRTSLWQKLVDAVRKHMGLSGRKEIDALSYTMRLVERAEDARARLTSQGNSGIAASESEAAPIFYSAVQRAVESMKEGKATAGQWLGQIRKAPRTRPEEIEFLGLEDWLNSHKGLISKQDLLNFIAANELQVSEVTASDTLDTDDIARYSSMRLAGPSKNYRELLITLPNKGGKTYEHEIHWPGKKNVVAHIRFDERVDAQGRKVLFINEMQSDWHSAGRVEGYVSPSEETRLSNELTSMESQYDSLIDELDVLNNGESNTSPEAAELRTRLTDLSYNIAQKRYALRELENRSSKKVPDAPFKKTWNELSMKRMARWAADNGFNVIAWPSTPEQVAEIEKWPDMKKRYNSEKEKDEYFVSNGKDEKNVTGIIESYTTFLPRTVNNMFQKLGVKTERVQLQPSRTETYKGTIPTKAEVADFAKVLRDQGDYEASDAVKRIAKLMSNGFSWEVALQQVRITEGDEFVEALVDVIGGEFAFESTQPEVNAIVLTPEMASSVLQGQPLFRERDYAVELMDAGVPEDMAREIHDTITAELGKSIDPSTLPLLMADIIAEYTQPATSRGNPSPPTPPITSGAAPASSAAPSPYVAATGGKFRRFAMKVTTLDYIRQAYDKTFGGLLDPYVKVIQRYDKIVANTSEPHDKDAADFLDLLRTDPEEGRKMADLAMEATRMNVRLGPGANNKHLAGKGKRNHQGRTRLAGLNARFDQLKPTTRALYKRMTENYRQTHNENVRALAYNLLTSLDLKNRLSNSDLMMLLDKTVAGTLTKEDANIIGEPKIYKELKRATTLRTIQGDYFPQMRFGDFVVLTKDKIADPGIKFVTSAGNNRIPVKTTVNDNIVSFQIDPMQRGGQAALNRAVMKYIEQSDLTLLRATKSYVERKTGKVTKPGDMDMTKDYDLVWNLEFQTRGVNFFESEVEANKFRNEVQAASGSQLEELSPVLDRRKDGEQYEKIISGSALSEVTKRINARKDLKPWQRKQMEAAVREAIISQMTGNRAQKRHMARRNVKGASNDIARAAVTYGQSAGNYYAMLTTANEVRESFNALEEYNTANQNKAGADVRSMVMNELRARQETLADPLYVNKLMQQVATISFLDKLFSAAHSIINFVQVVGNTVPYLGGKYGNARTATAVSRAYAKMGVVDTVIGGVKNTATAVKDWQRSWLDTTDLVGSIKKKLGPEYEALIDELDERGILEANSGFEIGAAVSGGEGVVGSTLAKLDRAARQLPASIEVVNRVVAAVATYDLVISESKSKNLPAGKAKQDAIQEAYNVISMTQGDYRKSNNPRFMRDPRLSWAMQFKKYAVMQSQLIGDIYVRALKGATPQERVIARKQLANLLTTQVMIAGAVGLPGLELIKVALLLTSVFTGFGWDDLEEELKEVLDESVGETASELIRKGVISRAIGVDVSTRMSQADLWTGFTPEKLDKDTIPKYIGSLLLGAPGGLAGDWVAAGLALKEGDITKFVEKAVPIKFAADTIAAAQSVQEGKMSPGEAVVKSIGFQPSRIANINEQIGREIRENKKVSDERNKLYKEYLNAATPGQVARVTAKIREFNARMGKDGRKLSLKSLEKRRRREMERYQQ